nr:DUF1269 domain-containing protein [Candidatus Chloroploca mongolica]
MEERTDGATLEVSRVNRAQFATGYRTSIRSSLTVDNKNHNVVVGIFDSEDAAESARDTIKSWDKASEEVKLGAIGIITFEKGKVKTHVGRQVGKGAVVGATVGVIAALLPAVGLIGGALIGTTGGAVVGTFVKKNLNLSKEDLQQIAEHLGQGKAALVVTADEDELAAVTEKIESLGGKTKKYEIPAEGLEEAQAALEAEATDA